MYIVLEERGEGGDRQQHHRDLPGPELRYPPGQARPRRGTLGHRRSD